MVEKQLGSDDYARARILLMCGQHREALREFRRILRRNPRDLDALYQVARLRMEMGKDVKARKLLGRCARMDARGKWSREIVLQLKRLGSAQSRAGSETGSGDPGQPLGHRDKGGPGDD